MPGAAPHSCPAFLRQAATIAYVAWLDDQLPKAGKIILSRLDARRLFITEAGAAFVKNAVQRRLEETTFDEDEEGQQAPKFEE